MEKGLLQGQVAMLKNFLLLWISGLEMHTFSLKYAEKEKESLQKAMTKEKQQAIKELSIIPGVGKSLATDLWNIGIKSISDLKGQDPEILFDLSNRFAGTVQDRCVLYVFRCAVYYADTPVEQHDGEKLKWWNWKDKKKDGPGG